MKQEWVSLESLGNRQWDGLLKNFENSSVFHLSAWREILETEFDVMPVYRALLAPDGRAHAMIAGYGSNSFFFGQNWATVYGGILADSKQNEAVALEHCRCIARALNCTKYTLRGGVQHDFGGEKVQKTVWPYIQLPKSKELFLGSLKKKMRHQVRRASELPFRTTILNEIPKEFFNVFAEVQRDLGTPVFDRNVFRRMNRVEGLEPIFIGLYRGDSLIGGKVAFLFGNKLYSAYAATLPEYQRGYANYKLYWAAIEFAIECGLKRFELGRTQPYSGGHNFKKKWADQERWMMDIYYDVKAFGGSKGPARLIGSNQKKSVMIWRELPLVLTNRLGPILRRKLPFG